MAKNIPAENFRFDEANSAGKHKFFLELGEETGIPLMVANGRSAGKTLVAFAAVHGDELEGVQAIQDIFAELDTDEMSGRFIAVPVANLPAFYAVNRLGPIDSLNLARTFPGKKDGSITERIAHYLGEVIIPEADFFIDLHSAPASIMPVMAGYDAAETEAGKTSKDAAMKLGMPVVWGHPDIGPGRSLCSAMERGIPWLYVESPSGRRVSPEVLPFYTGALRNLLGYLNIIEHAVPDVRPELYLYGSGDVDRMRSVENAGFFVQKVKLLEYVETGRLIGEVRNIFGDVIEEVRTEVSGYVAVLRSEPLVTSGEPVCLVAEGSRAES